MVPADLRKVFAAAPKAKAQWSDLTPLARKDFIMWIDSAKHSETRKRRIESIPSRLASGKRRPCCFAIVPINLHKALAGAPKAKVRCCIVELNWVPPLCQRRQQRKEQTYVAMVFAAADRRLRANLEL